MNIVDFTGKLNNHQDYIDVLNKIETKCKYVEIVILDGRKSNNLIDKFFDDIIETKKVSKWWGTETKGSNYLYRLKASTNLFSYLRNFDTFCRYYEYGSNRESLKKGDYSVITDFGVDDIAFYDGEDEYLLCTTTHEGYIAINKSLIE